MRYSLPRLTKKKLGDQIKNVKKGEKDN